MSLPNFYLEIVLESLAVMHLTYNCWLLGTGLSLYNEITKPTALICPCKVNNIPWLQTVSNVVTSDLQWYRILLTTENHFVLKTIGYESKVEHLDICE